KNEAVEFERALTTNSEGYYVVSAIPPGFYSVEVQHSGFQKYELVHKKLDPAIPSTVNITLTVGQDTQSVTVTATTAAVQSESATLGQLVEHTTVELTELNGRNPIFLAGLMPGVLGGNLATNSFNYSNGGLNVKIGRTEKTSSSS